MIGKFKHDLQTPALLVDLNIMEANLKTMASTFHNKKCKLRPHFKNIKCVALAEKQIEAGAIGITTATIPETEALTNAGVSSILIANEVAGVANLKSLLELTVKTQIILAVDNIKVVDEIAKLYNPRHHRLSLVVDIDLGLKRCGVTPGLAAYDIARYIIAKGLVFGGLMGYEGHLQRLTRNEDNLATRKQALNQLIVTKNLLESKGIRVDLVSAGGTGTSEIASSIEGITEVQPGNYLLMDTSYQPYAPEFKPSLTLLTTVTSVSPRERFILNAGVKEISGERGLPSVRNMKGVNLTALHAEHGIVEIRDPSLQIDPGDIVELDVYYSDATVNLHRRMYGIRNEKVEVIYNIGS